jgi:hypothetical protein
MSQYDEDSAELRGKRRVMGILQTHIQLLLKEHVSFPVNGRVLMLGQQAVLATVEDVKQMMGQSGCIPRPLPQGFDTKSRTQTLAGWGGDSIDGRTLFRLLGADSVRVLDFSDYEGADIIWDFNEPVPHELHNQFELVFDAGTLEHVFDLPTALASLVNMVGVGGILILINPSSGMVDHGFYNICPTLFYDYFRANGFGDFSCYLMEGQRIDQKMRVYKYERPRVELRTSFCEGFDVGFFCRKLREVPTISKPVQYRYAEKPEHVESAKDPAPIKAAVKMLIKKNCPNWLLHQLLQRQNGLRRSRSNIHFVGKF